MITQSFQVQSIPAVYAIKNRQIVDRFIGALGEAAVREFVNQPPAGAKREQSGWSRPETRPRCVARSSSSLTCLPPSSPWPSCSSHAEKPEEALSLLARIPDTGDARRVAALARLAIAGTP